MAKILVVEDDPELCITLKEWLKRESHVLEMAPTGTEALYLLRLSNYDLVILDLHLPDMDGVTVCKEVRSNDDALPILMLTARTDIADKELGLDIGADDYLTKPFNPRELSARIRVLLRRSSQNKQPVLTVGQLVLEPKLHRLLKGGQEIELLPREFALLEFLMRHAGVVFSAEALLDRVWRSDSESSPDSVRMHIARLRKKLDTEGCPSVIRTVHGVGYTMVPNAI